MRVSVLAAALLASTLTLSDGGLPWHQREASGARNCEEAASLDGAAEGITAAVAVRHGLYIRFFAEAGDALEAQLYQRLSPVERTFRASLVLVAPRHADKDSRGSILQPFGSNYALEEQFECPKFSASDPAKLSLYGYKVWNPPKETEIATDPVLPRSDVLLAKAHLHAEAKGWHYWVAADVEHTTRRCQLNYQGWSSKPSLRPECSVQVVISPGQEVNGWGFWELIALPFLAAPLHHWEGIDAATAILPALLAALAVATSMCYIARRWNWTAEVRFDYVMVADGLLVIIVALYCGSAVHRMVILLVFASRSLFGVLEVLFILAVILVTLAFAGVAVRTWWYIRRDVSHSTERRVSLGVASFLALFCFGAGVLFAPILGMVAAALPEWVMYRACLPLDLTTTIRRSCAVCWNKCSSLGNIADKMTFQDTTATGDELDTSKPHPEIFEAQHHPSAPTTVPVPGLPSMAPPPLKLADTRPLHPSLVDQQQAPPSKLDDMCPPHPFLVHSGSPPSTASTDRKQLFSARSRPDTTEDPPHRLANHVCDSAGTHDTRPVFNVRPAAMSAAPMLATDGTEWMRCPPPPPKTPALRNGPVPPVAKIPATPSRSMTPPQTPTARGHVTDALKDALGTEGCFALPPLPSLGLEVARIPAVPRFLASPAPAGVHSMSSSGSRSGTSSSGKHRERPLKRHMHHMDRERKRVPPPILVSETNSSAEAECCSPMVSRESPLFGATIAENSKPFASVESSAPTTPPRVQHPGWLTRSGEQEATAHLKGVKEEQGSEQAPAISSPLVECCGQVPLPPLPPPPQWRASAMKQQQQHQYHQQQHPDPQQLQPQSLPQQQPSRLSDGAGGHVEGESQAFQPLHHEVPPPPPPLPSAGPPRAPDEPPLPAGSLRAAGQSQASSLRPGVSAFAQAQLAARRLSEVSPRRLGSTGILRQANGGLPKCAMPATHLQAPEPAASVKGPSKPTTSGSTLNEEASVSGLSSPEAASSPEQPALPVIRPAEQQPDMQTHKMPDCDTTANKGEADLKLASPTDSVSQLLWNEGDSPSAVSGTFNRAKLAARRLTAASPRCQHKPAQPVHSEAAQTASALPAHAGVPVYSEELSKIMMLRSPPNEQPVCDYGSPMDSSMTTTSNLSHELLGSPPLESTSPRSPSAQVKAAARRLSGTSPRRQGTPEEDRLGLAAPSGPWPHGLIGRPFHGA